jgi:hypothetical protein
MEDDTEYLQEDFDPTTLRVADLRRILLFHDIDFPSSSKKAQLINLFAEHITPNASALLRKKSRVRPSGKGIKAEKDENGEVQPQIFLPEVRHCECGVFFANIICCRRCLLDPHLGRESRQLR